MALGLVGRKVGMTRIFGKQGEAIPVTVLEVPTNCVTQKKSKETDGYSAVQLAFGRKKANRVNKAQAGHFAKVGVEAGSGLIEFLLDEDQLAQLELGKNIDVSIFEEGQLVDVTGISKGKGFAGNIKRNKFSSQRASHGNSLSHSAPGSIGQCQDPGRVFKGKKMPGHLGSRRVTTQNLRVVRVDVQRQLLLIRGAIPGSVNSDVIVRPSVKRGI
ncbi:MAG: 50S ribosomal protein L3 [Neisseriaceae bacterium]|nr:MAG: 50S ribosomal protein L3 [Neisseriaceae bacterium]